MSLRLKKSSVGKVHSKFNNGLNVQFDDYLIHVGCLGTHLSAFGMNIEEEKLKHLLNSVRNNDVVVNKGSKLIFYSIHEPIYVDYKEMQEINLKIPPITCSVNEIAESQLYKYLVTIEFEKYIGINLDEKSSTYVDLLLYADKENLHANMETIRFFVGRGIGLTPSGDDMLLGFTLALMLFGKFNTWKQVLQSEVARDRTTIISAAYLGALLEGYMSERFIPLVNLLDHIEIDTIEKTLNEVRSFGHTSGNDTLFGFFLGLKFLITQRE